MIADDQSNPANDVQLANDLIAKHVAVIMGSALVANCNAMVPLVKNGPVLYCLSPALHPDPGKLRVLRQCRGQRHDRRRYPLRAAAGLDADRDDQPD